MKTLEHNIKKKKDERHKAFTEAETNHYAGLSEIMNAQRLQELKYNMK